MTKSVTVDTWTIHVWAECSDCDKIFDDRKKGRRQAYDHARRTGHEVKCDVDRVTVYNRRAK